MNKETINRHMNRQTINRQMNRQTMDARSYKAKPVFMAELMEIVHIEAAQLNKSSSTQNADLLKSMYLFKEHASNLKMSRSN